MKTEELAERVLEERRSMAARQPGVAYYMMNLNHPAVGALYQLWLNEQGPPRNGAQRPGQDLL